MRVSHCRHRFDPTHGHRPAAGSRRAALAPFLAAGALLAAFPASAAAPEAALSAAHGPSAKAPLLVYFQGTGSTDPDTSKPIHHLTYCFDAGDGNTDAYTLAGHKAVPKAQWCGGPQFAYVYEKPGNYTATLTVYDEQGNIDTTSVAIRVDGFANSQTVCVAAGQDPSYAGCPSGATRKTEGDAGYASFNSAVATGCSNFDQVLFQRGSAFSITNTAKVSCSAVGTYGSGARTRLEGSGMSPVFDIDGDDRRVWGFSFTGTGVESHWSADVSKNGNDGDFVLVRDMGATNINAIVSLSGTAQGSGSGYTLNDIVGLFESEYDDVANQGPSAIFVAARRFALVGNVLHDSRDGEHVVRLQHVGEDANGSGGAFVSANRFSRAASTKALYSIRAASTNQSWGGDFWNENIVTADNWFMANTTVPVDFQTNKSTDSGFLKRRNHIFERNFLTIDEPNDGIVKATAWRDEGTTIDMTFRNNLIDLRGANSGARAFTKMGDGGWEISNNSVLGEAAQIFWEDASGTGCTFRNNVFWSTSGSARFFSGSACETQESNYDTDGSGSGVDSGIRALSSCPFQSCNTTPSTPAQFRTDGVDLRNIGVAVPVAVDFDMRRRPSDTGWDVGAWEFGATLIQDSEDLAAPFLR